MFQDLMNWLQDGVGFRGVLCSRHAGCSDRDTSRRRTQWQSSRESRIFEKYIKPVVCGVQVIVMYNSITCQHYFNGLLV